MPTNQNAFFDFFDRLFDRGSHSSSDAGTPWTDSRFSQASGLTEGAVRTWRARTSLPSADTFATITRIFFGDRETAEVAQFREAYGAARRIRRPTKEELSDEIPPIRRFCGRFIRLFIKPMSPEVEELGVHLGDFRIEENGSRDEADVTVNSFKSELENANQNPKDYELAIPVGKLKLLDHRLEMSISYGRNLPASRYLGVKPDGIVTSFLMMNLDIAFETHEVGVQPMLFIKIKDTETYPTVPIDQSCTLFSKLSDYFEVCVEYDRTKFELSQSYKVDPEIRSRYRDVSKALRELNNDSATAAKKIISASERGAG